MDHALRERDDLRGCRASCCHCGIEFLTAPANARREDLRCPFGCRQQHRREQSNRRCTEYYRTESGRAKKKRLNGRRTKQQASSAPSAPSAPSGSSDDVSSAAIEQASLDETLRVTSSSTASLKRSSPAHPPLAAPLSLQLPGSIQLTEAMLERSPVLPYVQLLFALFGGRRMNRQELLKRLRHRMRQHSLLYQNRRDYVVQFLHEQPP